MPVEREFTRLRNNSRRIVGPLFLFAVSHPVSYRVDFSLSLPFSNSTLFHPLNYFVSVTLATNGKPSNHVSPLARIVLGLVNTRISIPQDNFPLLFFFFFLFHARVNLEEHVFRKPVSLAIDLSTRRFCLEKREATIGVKMFKKIGKIWL